MYSQMRKLKTRTRVYDRFYYVFFLLVTRRSSAPQKIKRKISKRSMGRKDRQWVENRIAFEIVKKRKKKRGENLFSRMNLVNGYASLTFFFFFTTLPCFFSSFFLSFFLSDEWIFQQMNCSAFGAKTWNIEIFNCYSVKRDWCSIYIFMRNDRKIA